MGHKIAIRVKPLKQWSDVSNATRHGKREDPAKHVDRTRTHLNQHWLYEAGPDGKGSINLKDEPIDIEQAFVGLAKSQGVKWRKGAIVGTEMLFIASPGFFGPPGPIRDARARKWSVDCLKAVVKKYPGQVAAARLDLDETTPHFSVFLLPQYVKDYAGEERKSTRKPKRAISHNQVFGTPDKLSALQDWAADAMKAAGHKLERGEPKTAKGADHVTPAEHRRRIQRAEEEAQGITRDAEKAAEALLGDARAQAAQIIEKATPERFRALQRENADLRQQVTAWTAFRDLFRDKVKAFLTAEAFQRFAADVNASWGKHPDNPKREEPDPESPPRRDWGGPSGP